METFSVSLAFLWGIRRDREFPAKRPVTRSFDVFFDLRLNKRLSKQSWGWWFETPSWSLLRHCNGTTLLIWLILRFTKLVDQVQQITLSDTHLKMSLITNLVLSIKFDNLKKIQRTLSIDNVAVHKKLCPKRSRQSWHTDDTTVFITTPNEIKGIWKLWYSQLNMFQVFCDRLGCGCVLSANGEFLWYIYPYPSEPRFTKVFYIAIEIRWKFLFTLTSNLIRNKVLYKERQLCCRGMCQILLWPSDQ